MCYARTGHTALHAMRTTGVALLALLVSLAVHNAHAQNVDVPLNKQPKESITEGLFGTLQGSGSGLVVDNSDAESGGGLDLRLGYGFTPLFSMYANIGGASMTAKSAITGEPTSASYSLGYFDLGGQLNFRSGEALVPYLETAVTGIAAVFDGGSEDLTVSGAGLSAGGGLKYFFTPSAALNGGLMMTIGNFNQAEYASETAEMNARATAARLKLGITVYPF